MAIRPKFDFSAESKIKDSLFSEMSAVFASAADKKNNTKESISFEDMQNEVFGFAANNVSKPAAPGVSEPQAKKKREGGMQP